MSFQALCPKCQILLFDVKSFEGFGGSHTITCRSCGAEYSVSEQDGQIFFKRMSWKRWKKAVSS